MGCIISQYDRAKSYREFTTGIDICLDPNLRNFDISSNQNLENTKNTYYEILAQLDVVTSTIVRTCIYEEFEYYKYVRKFYNKLLQKNKWRFICRLASRICYFMPYPDQYQGVTIDTQTAKLATKINVIVALVAEKIDIAHVMFTNNRFGDNILSSDHFEQCKSEVTESVAGTTLEDKIIFLLYHLEKISIYLADYFLRKLADIRLKNQPTCAFW